jgi:hypothetical protein
MYVAINNTTPDQLDQEPAIEEQEATGNTDDVLLVSAKKAFEELEFVPNPFSLLDLDAKLKQYQNMIGLVRNDSNRGTTASLRDVIERLEARKHYRDKQKVRDFFNQFQNTSDDKINDLLDRPHLSHLKMGVADDFIPEMPADALDVMISYGKETIAITKKKPVFYLIAKNSDFKTKKGERTKRDPILLVQSPFGFYWQVLGAWNEEMLLLNDL